MDSEFKSSLGYRMSSRTARPAQRKKTDISFIQPDNKEVITNVQKMTKILRRWNTCWKLKKKKKRGMDIFFFSYFKIICTKKNTASVTEAKGKGQISSTVSGYRSVLPFE